MKKILVWFRRVQANGRAVPLQTSNYWPGMSEQKVEKLR